MFGCSVKKYFSVEEAAFWKLVIKKIACASNDPKMTLNVTMPKVAKYVDYCSRVPNFTPFRSIIDRFPDNWGFWFPRGVYGEFDIFEKKILLKSGSQSFKILNLILWGQLWGKFMSSYVWKPLAAICSRGNVLNFLLLVGPMLSKRKKIAKKNGKCFISSKK